MRFVYVQAEFSLCCTDRFPFRSTSPWCGRRREIELERLLLRLILIFGPSSGRFKINVLEVRIRLGAGVELSQSDLLKPWSFPFDCC